MRIKKQKGNSIITVPVITGIGLILIATLLMTIIKIIMPYIAYEKMASTSLKYVFIMEEFGYLTKKEALMLLSDLEQQGFEKNKIKLEYTNKKVKYGEEIYLKINYDYAMKLPTTGVNVIPMKIEKYSICKR